MIFNFRKPSSGSGGGSIDGLMSSADKAKLDGIAANANNYIKPASEPISYITNLQATLDSKATNTALNVEKSRIDAILASAGANTDTFAEIVALINSVDTENDTAFSGYVLSNNNRSTAIENTLINKVDIIAGKGLSTEDYTTADKNKLNNIENNANNYTLPVATANGLGGIKIGAGLTISNGVVSVNAGGTADSVNWSGVISTPTTLAGFGITDAYTKTEVDTMIGDIASALDTINGHDIVSALDTINGQVI